MGKIILNGIEYASGGGGGGSSSLAGLSDVDLSAPSDGQVLIYDSNSSKWKNGGVLHEYTATEKIVGTWFGKPLYEKSVDIGELPNNAQKQVAHNISNLKNAVEISGYAVNSSNVLMPLPYVHPLGLEYAVAVTITTTTVNINTGRDRTGFTGYVTLRYTKTTD